MNKKIIFGMSIILLLIFVNVTLAQSSYRGMSVTQGFVTKSYAERSQEPTPVSVSNTGGPPYFLNYVETSNLQGKNAIALTFDLCSDKYNSDLINYLIQEKIPATFFISEKWVNDGHSADLQTIINAKDASGNKLFEIGSHSKTHPSSKGSSIFWGGTGNSQDMLTQWKDSVNFLRNQGAEINLCRLPVAQPWTMQAAGTLDLLKNTVEYCSVFVQYDIWATEGKGVSATKYSDSVLSKLSPNKASIVLSHANQPTWNEYEGIKLLVPELKKRNYEILTVSQLLNKYAVAGAGTGVPKLTELTLREKIGQMIMATPGKDGVFVSEFGLGGVILMQDEEGTGTVSHQQGMGGEASQDQISERITNYQSKAKVSLLVSTDAEGGGVNRIKHLSDPGDARTMGEPKEIAQKISAMAIKLNQIGINIDLAPVVDVAKPDGTLMAKRSFSGDAAVVEADGRAFVEALQSNRVGATLKHFPGYGDESRNSDIESVKVQAPREADLNVFNNLKKDADLIMMSNIIYTDLDKTNPAVVSPKIVGMARENFDGVIISDDLSAKSIEQFYKNNYKKMAVDAVKAGVDILLIVNYKKSDADTEANIKAMIDGVEAAVNSGEITEARIEESIKRIESLKKKYAMSYQASSPIENPYENCIPGTTYGGGSLNIDLTREDLVDIPSDINCVARRCQVKASVLPALYALRDEFAQNGCELQITSAYRTLEEYRSNWVNKVLKVNGDRRKYCGPQPRSTPYDLSAYEHCPHYNGGAVDIKTAKCTPTLKRTLLACQAGWARYMYETWHFEYGTSAWKRTMAKGVCGFSPYSISWSDLTHPPSFDPNFDTSIKTASTPAVTPATNTPIPAPETAAASSPTDASTTSTNQPASPTLANIPSVTSSTPPDALKFTNKKSVIVDGAQISNINIIEVDTRYFEVKTLSAKKATTEIGNGKCTACADKIYDLRSKYLGLNYVAGINAAFFGLKEGETAKGLGIKNPDEFVAYGMPTGDFIEDGKYVQGKPAEDSFTKYFVVEGSTPKIISREEFESKKDSNIYTSAVTGSESTIDEVRPRTQVCITSDGKVKLVTSSPAVISKLEKYLKQNEGCAEVLNLDGGQSTQMYYDWNTVNEKVESNRRVANFIVVVPRSGTGSPSGVAGQPQFCPPASINNFEGKDEILYAAYMIPGSFSTVIDYNLDPFKNVQNKMKELVTGTGACAASTTVQCLDDQTNSDPNSKTTYYFKSNQEYVPLGSKADWNKFCVSKDEEFFSDFAEIFNNCMNSEDGCYCDLNPNDNTLTEDRLMTFSELSDTRYDVSLERDDKTFELFTLDKKVDFPDNISSKNIANYRYLVKKKDSIFFASSPSLSNSCDIEEPKIKVCVVNKNISIFAKNPISEKLSSNPMTIKFSFLPPNTPPPNVKGVTAFDLNRSNDTVVLSWFKSPATNIENYTIYKNIADFKDKTSEEAKTIVAEILSVNINDAETVSSVDNLTLKCVEKNNKECSFEFPVSISDVEETLKPENKLLIFESDTNRYYYVMNIADSVQTFFGVTAVNKKQLESAGFDDVSSAISIDDLPPGYVGQVSSIPANPATGEGPSIEFSKPATNLDGSSLDPASQVWFYLIQECADGTKKVYDQKEYTSTSAVQKILNIVPDADCSFKVIATKKTSKPEIWAPLVKLPDSSQDDDIINYLLK